MKTKKKNKRPTPKWKVYNALRNARCDLSLAVSYPDINVYRSRCEQTIAFITEVLQDQEEFAKTQARWDEEKAKSKY